MRTRQGKTIITVVIEIQQTGNIISDTGTTIRIAILILILTLISIPILARELPFERNAQPSGNGIRRFDWLSLSLSLSPSTNQI